MAGDPAPGGDGVPDPIPELVAVGNPWAPPALELVDLPVRAAPGARALTTLAVLAVGIGAGAAIALDAATGGRDRVVFGAVALGSALVGLSLVRTGARLRVDEEGVELGPWPVGRSRRAPWAEVVAFDVDPPPLPLRLVLADGTNRRLHLLHDGLARASEAIASAVLPRLVHEALSRLDRGETLVHPPVPGRGDATIRVDDRAIVRDGPAGRIEIPWEGAGWEYRSPDEGALHGADGTTLDIDAAIENRRVLLALLPVRPGLREVVPDDADLAHRARVDLIRHRGLYAKTLAAAVAIAVVGGAYLVDAGGPLVRARRAHRALVARGAPVEASVVAVRPGRLGISEVDFHYRISGRDCFAFDRVRGRVLARGDRVDALVGWSDPCAGMLARSWVGSRSFGLLAIAAATLVFLVPVGLVTHVVRELVRLRRRARDLEVRAAAEAG